MMNAYDLMTRLEETFYDRDKLTLLESLDDEDWQSLSFDDLKFFVDFYNSTIERLASYMHVGVY